jgi:hypothetical protein
MDRTAEPTPDLVLEGVVTEADHETYLKLPFDAPTGVTRLTVAFDYDRAHRTTLDLGLVDPERFRGWSGGERRLVTLSAEEATPSYLPGPIPAGRWTILVGVPNIRKGVRAAYKAQVWFGTSPVGPSVSTFSEAPLRTGRAWYRGDLHMHTAHSDGSCCAQSGVRSPAPLYRTVEAAAARGLDFIAITDHNTTSHFHAMRELQPAFDRLLLIPGREITTFHGHANVFGPTGFIDFRLGAESLPTAGALMDAAEAMAGVFAIAHPLLPSGELCMGCGWTARDTDFSRVRVIEVSNGGAARATGNEEGAFSGIPFWHARLMEGLRITGVGGSDNHDPSLAPDIASAVGMPTTLVEATELSETAIMAGILAGRVAIDLDGAKDRSLDFVARLGEASACMGDEIFAPAGVVVEFEVQVRGVEAGRLEVIVDGVVTEGPSDPTLDKSFADPTFNFTADGADHWIRLNVRDRAGRLILIGNPIYLNGAGEGRPPRSGYKKSRT